MSHRDQILGHRPTLQFVPTAFEGCYVREMSGSDVASFQRFLASREGEAEAVETMSELLVRTLCNADGERLFKDDEAGLVADLPTLDLHEAYRAAERLNTVTRADVEHALGNSAATARSEPASPSPANSA